MTYHGHLVLCYVSEAVHRVNVGRLQKSIFVKALHGWKKWIKCQFLMLKDVGSSPTRVKYYSIKFLKLSTG